MQIKKLARVKGNEGKSLEIKKLGDNATVTKVKTYSVLFRA
jgi:hypothetical protein